MLFFESLRTAAGRYSAGVHALGDPTPPTTLAAAEARLATALPPSYRELLRSFNGISLFHESYVLFPIEEVQRGGPQQQHLRLGETPEGTLFMACGSAGRLLLVDEAAPDPIVAGSSLERWLDATVAREGLLVDREGEFRDVFTDDGLKLPIRRKRVQLGRRHDPQAALYFLEEAELKLEEAQPTAAVAALQAAVACDPDAGPAWELLATLYLDAEDRSAAAAAQQAALATWHEPLREARQTLALRSRTQSALRIL
jgi:tetratricopeptide (TPR) repeat protein